MANKNETILKEGKYWTYTEGPYDVRPWDLWMMERRNFLFAAFIGALSGKRRRRSKLLRGERSKCHEMNYERRGSAFLTDKRFIFGKRKFVTDKSAPGVVSLTKGEKYFAIPIANIERIERGRNNNLLFAECLSIVTKDGTYEFIPYKTDEWEVALNEALAQRGATPEAEKYCPKCAYPMSDGAETCLDCGESQLEEPKVSKWSKAHILKMWLFGVFGLLGFHFFASCRNLQGMVRLIWSIIWGPICVMLLLDEKIRQSPKLLVTFLLMLLLFPMIDLVKISIGKFRDVYKKYVV